MAAGNDREVRLAGQLFRVRIGEIERIAKRIEPKPISTYFVKLGGQNIPVKQLVAELTGLGLSEFTSQDAIRVARQLGVEIRR